MLITNVRHDGGEHKRAGLERQGGRRRHMNSHTIRPVTPIALRGTARRRIHNSPSTTSQWGWWPQFPKNFWTETFA